MKITANEELNHNSGLIKCNQDKNSLTSFEEKQVDLEKGIKTGLKDAEVQCILPKCNSKKPPQFTIKDIKARRQLVRKLYGVLIIQQCLVLISMETFLRTSSQFVSDETYSIIGLVVLLVYLLMYFVRRQRRFKPLNYLFFIMTSILYIAEEMFYAKMKNTQLVLIQPIFIITQLTFLTLYTKQRWIRFTNFRGILVTVIIFCMCLASLVIWTAAKVLPILTRTLIFGCYMIYDTQVILTGQHGYEIQPNEYLFAATNIYADWAIFLWRVFKFIFFEHFIAMTKFLVKCCKAEVC